ncbi:MAG: hypothetical protein ABH954_03915 [Candidatus Omnitrophota bacterium]
MKISVKEWVIFIVIALIAVGVWYRFSYPQFQFVDLKITKQQAIQKATNYLSEKGIDTSPYLKSTVFVEDSWADRYLQQTLGFEKEEQFIKKHDYELFYWMIRFFRENEKEEFYIQVSSKSGEIIKVSHYIKDTAARPALDKKRAKNLARQFLEERFNTDFAYYDLHDELAKKFDKRTDYSFSWEKKDVYIPWGEEEDAGGAKLLAGVTVSGEEARDFFKSKLDIPEKFKRYVENQMILGNSIAGSLRLVFLAWLVWAVYIIMKRRTHLVVDKSSRIIKVIGWLIFIAAILYSLNHFQSILFGYPTSSFLMPFIIGNFINIITNSTFMAASVVLIGLAAESLRHEVLPDKKLSSFFHYINSTFWSRSSAQLVLFGYVFFLILLGLQSAAFHLGQTYIGVWVERIKFTELSSAYIPFLSALLIGYRASFSEEIVYRIFGISWAKKYTKNIFLAVLITALVWGFSHTGYAIFPVWFRGIEVTFMGIVFAFIFLRYGIIPVLVAHYLFDVFWGVAGYILGNSTPYLFFSSVFIMMIPLILACVCYVLNRKEIERKLEPSLNADQKYNLGILMTFISDKKRDKVPADIVKQELISHGWDQVLVELAIEKYTQ